MGHKKLTKRQLDLIVQRYCSGEGYTTIKKALDTPWNTVKIVINKWRKNGTTVTLSRTEYPSNIDEKTKRKLVRKAVKRPTATFFVAAGLSGKYWLLPTCDNYLLFSSSVWAMGYGPGGQDASLF